MEGPKKLIKSRFFGIMGVRNTPLDSLRLFEFQTGHQPVELSPGNRFYFVFIAWPLISADMIIQFLVEKDKAIRGYYGAAKPPVRQWRSHLSGLTEPPAY